MFAGDGNTSGRRFDLGGDSTSGGEDVETESDGSDGDMDVFTLIQHNSVSNNFCCILLDSIHYTESLLSPAITRESKSTSSVGLIISPA